LPALSEVEPTMPPRLLTGLFGIYDTLPGQNRYPIGGYE